MQQSSAGDVESTGPVPGRLEAARVAVRACADALTNLRSVLVLCGNRDLAQLAGELAEVRARAGAALVAVTAEAESRGVIAESQCGSTAAWVSDSAWFSRRESATIAKAAALLGATELASVADALASCDIDPRSAIVVGAEFAKLAPDLQDAAKPIVLDAMVDVAANCGPAAVRRLKDEILARYGSDGHFEAQAERHRRHIDLSAGRQTLAGLWDYRLTLDTESRAVLEGVIGPGAAPRPNRDTGQRDERPVGRRRGESLIAALRRSVTAAAHVPTSPKSILMITMDHRALSRRVLAKQQGAVREETLALADGELSSAPGLGVPSESAPLSSPGCAATVLGSRAAGDLLPASTARRLACDAGVIPVVLGADGEVLDQGRMQRLFTTAQVRALWLRDGHCSFPGCDTPAAWCDAHHLVHWVDGGRTELSNAALLCPRHHTVVHRDRLAGRVDGAVIWDLRPGSYREPAITAVGVPMQRRPGSAVPVGEPCPASMGANRATDAVKPARAGRPVNAVMPPRAELPVRAVAPPRAELSVRAVAPPRAESPVSAVIPPQAVPSVSAVAPPQAVPSVSAVAPLSAVAPASSIAGCGARFANRGGWTPALRAATTLSQPP